MRLALCVSYNGFNYYGWQRQPDELPCIQQILEKAISKVADHLVEVICAGRTDKGVHALGQVVHFDTHAERNQRGWLLGINTHLPHDVRVQWVQPVIEDFHARFSAVSRRYRYVIYNNFVPSALFHQQTTWYLQPLDEKKMAEAGQYLIGEHDFSSYRAVECQARSPVRTVHDLTITRQNKFIFMDIQANAFLHHMVRNIAGVLMSIGSGHHPPIWAQEVLAAKDRRVGDITAPANGLYFMEVSYPENFDLPKQHEGLIF